MHVRTELYPAERITQPPPTTFPGDYRASLRATEHDLGPTAAISIEGGAVNHEAIVFRRWPLDISFARPWDGDRFRQTWPRVRFAVKNYVLRRPRHAGRLLWCLDNLSPDNWYHWLTEVLPRLFAARSLWASIDYLALPHYYARNRFVTETLDIWSDLPPVLWIPRTQRVIGHPLIVVERTAAPWSYRPSVMRALADDMVDKCTSNGGSGRFDRLYVSRSDAAWRRVANEDDVRAMLEGLGFTTIHAGRMSVREQITAFSGASVVVGAHGAGLSNMLFCRPGATVIELCTADPHRHWQCYANLAFAMELRYGLVCSPTTAAGDAGFEERRDADLVVDVDSLAEAVAFANE